ncbi:42063_t:CDS:2, partial [Gigaspora margarita]
TTQEPPVFEVTSSYQERDDESDVSRLSKTSEFKQSSSCEVSENFAPGEPTKVFNASGSQGGFGSFRERSSVNVTTSAPAFATSAPIAFGAVLSASDNVSGIPPAFATPPNNVSALGSLPAPPSQTFGQSAFGQSSFGAANLQAFGQPAFGQPAFGQPVFGQPAFGQHGFGQARPIGTPAVLFTAMKPKVVADLLGSQGTRSSCSLDNNSHGYENVFHANSNAFQ